MGTVSVQVILLCLLVAPSFQDHEVHCGVPGNITHGHYEYLSHHDDDTYLSVIKYTCDAPIYHLQDPEEAVYICTEHSKWSNAKLKHRLPKCQKVHCPPPTDVAHGHYEYITTHGTTSYLSAIKYTCDANYHERDFSDEGVYICTIDGKWRNTDLEYELPTCEPVECGKPLVSLEPLQRIIGGRMVVHGASPWTVLMKSEEGDIIDGVLIDHRWVLTSARALQHHHPLEADVLAKVKVYVGVEDSREVDLQHQHQVAGVYYNNTRTHEVVRYHDDLALVKLAGNVTFSNRVMPLCLPSRPLAQAGKVGQVAGWGVGLDLAPVPHLLYVTLEVADSQECRSELTARYPGHFLADDPDQFCTQRSPLMENVCRGDRGAAFAVEEHGTHYAAGVLAYDEACRGYSYAVYTEVFGYLDWIKEIMEHH
ncbi:haptoglobin-like [Carcharodon carcharias]|uniref:haptoglobin-like n=1 Tax=Carcharodon carcharias TaxID=13397 RepID=UPI001B7F0BF5|nr:haptoglobin-like [Carcharodon carcharias]